jgi:hypothetical protein
MATTKHLIITTTETEDRWPYVHTLSVASECKLEDIARELNVFFTLRDLKFIARVEQEEER